MKETCYEKRLFTPCAFLYCEQMIYFDDKIVAVPIADGSAEAEDEKHE